MATFFHLLHDTSWEDIQAHLVDPKDYRDFYVRLRLRNPVPNTENVVLTVKENQQSIATAGGKGYSTMGSLLNQWLGYVIDYPADWTKEQAVAAVFYRIQQDKQKLLENTKQLLADFARFE